VLEPATAQELLHLPHHEARQHTGLLGALAKRWPVLLDDPVQNRRFGAVPLIATRTRVSVRWRRTRRVDARQRRGGQGHPALAERAACRRPELRGFARLRRTRAGEPGGRRRRPPL
jgi:hypothetical protein